MAAGGAASANREAASTSRSRAYAGGGATDRVARAYESGGAYVPTAMRACAGGGAYVPATMRASAASAAASRASPAAPGSRASPAAPVSGHERTASGLRKGDRALYASRDEGTVEVDIVAVHNDDPEDVYVTVRMPSGVERSTVPGKLRCVNRGAGTHAVCTHAGGAGGTSARTSATARSPPAKPAPRAADMPGSSRRHGSSRGGVSSTHDAPPGEDAAAGRSRTEIVDLEASGDGPPVKRLRADAGADAGGAAEPADLRGVVGLEALVGSMEDQLGRLALAWCAARGVRRAEDIVAEGATLDFLAALGVRPGEIKHRIMQKRLARMAD